MSIFKQTFPDFVQNELKTRQELLSDPIKRGDLVNYQTSRNSWIRMTSGVNVINNGVPDNGALAKQYVLLGGTLRKRGLTTNSVEGESQDIFSQKSGIGSAFDKYAYSNKNATGKDYLRGIRPMPGINSISTSTKAAYGSLIEVVVSFQCWDIRQLEDLELLYMRPGYTVLIEWGWAYGKQSPLFYDILNKGNIDFQKVNKELFNLSKDNNGNYEAILGYVKNYNWKARPDGGYDCTTSIISFGEVIESIKVNYAPYNINYSSPQEPGIIKKGTYGFQTGVKVEDIPVSSINKADVISIQDQYAKGILNGLFYELRLLIEQMPDAGTLAKDSANSYEYPSLDIITPNSINRRYFVFKKEFIFKQTTDEQKPNSIFGNNRHYITLQSLCTLINDYVLIRNSNSSGSLLAEMSTKDRIYAGYNNTLTCLAHPLQVSTDPTKCLIKAEYWINGKNISTGQSIDDTIKLNKDIADEAPTIQPNPVIRTFLNNRNAEGLLAIITRISDSTKIGSEINSLPQVFIKLRDQIEGSISAIQEGITYNITSDGTTKGNSWGNITNQAAINNSNANGPLGLNILALMGVSADQLYNDIISYISNNASLVKISKDLSKLDTDYILNPNNKNIIIQNITNGLNFQNFKTIHAQSLANNFTGRIIESSFKKAAEALEGLKLLKQYFVGEAGRLGEISNIYVDLEYLMELASSPNIESRDTQNKNTISLINFFKEILKTIQSCTGNINNFDVHIDKDSIGRIIDINFTDDDNLSQNKDKIFQIELHNLKSTIRNYQLESKIFPEQGTIVAISAQATIPGKLGYNNSTLVAYNRGVEDRLIPQKLSASDYLQAPDLSSVLTTNFVPLLKYFDFLNNSDTNTSYSPGEYNNALRDLIGFFNGLAESNPNQFKAIIPIMLSFDMDGIGGIIVGNIFRINDDVLPSGYNSPDLGFLVKSFNHKIENSDWITTLEAYPVILDNQDKKFTENNTITYWNDFFGKAIKELRTIDTRDVDLTNIRAVSPNASVSSAITPILDNKNNIPKGVKILMEAHAQIEGFYPDTPAYRNNNPGNLVYDSRYNKFGATREPQGRFASFPTLEKGLDAKFDYIQRVNNNQHSRYPKGTNSTLLEYISIYAPSSDGNNPLKYATNIIGYFKKKGVNIQLSTTIGDIFKITQ
jgi:hypothetical protein